MTLDEIIDEQNVIQRKLDEMAENPDTTEDADANLRDTLIARWKDLEKDREPLVKQLEDLKMISRAARDRANTESGDGGGDTAGRWSGNGRGPEFMRRNDPFEGMDMVRQNLVPGKELISRAMTMVEHDDKVGRLFGDRGEESNRKANLDPRIARHMLLTGYDEYVEAFRTYLNDPMGEGQAAVRALALGTASAGYLLPYVLDQLVA